MEVTAKELRRKLRTIIEQAARCIEVVITVHGKKMAKLVPYRAEESKNHMEDEIFGLWKNRNDIDSVDDYVRFLRKGRTF